MKLPGEKLIIKLWESIADKGVGTLLKPWQIRREGRASIDVKREELLVLAQAELDVAAIRSGKKALLIDGTLVEQQLEKLIPIDAPALPPLLINNINNVAESNFRAEAIRREISLAKSVIYAEEELAQDTQEPPLEKVSDDWLLRWRDCAANVSSEELQSLWGKVLAGEVKQPGQYSLRTLEFLRNLSQEEAKAIEMLSPFVVSGIVYRGDDALLESAGVTFSLLLTIQEIGIISGAGAIGFNTTWSSMRQDRFEHALVSYRRVLLVTHSDTTKQFSVPSYQLTALGRQILNLGFFEPNDKYLQSLGTVIKNQGFDVVIGNCAPAGGEKIQLFNLQPLDTQP